MELRPCNAVTSVAVDAASVPLTPVPAGRDLAVVVDIVTEDKNPVPLADVMRGLTLQVMSPGTKSRAAQVRLMYANMLLWMWLPLAVPQSPLVRVPRPILLGFDVILACLFVSALKGN